MKNKIERALLLKIITNNLGRVEETEDKIICYVKKHKCKQNSYQITIPCHGQRKEYEEATKKHNLNKPIVYVIEDIVIKNKKVFIFGYDDAEVIIKNCAFLFDLTGHINGKCTIEHTFVRAFSSFMFGANELTIKNQSITNPFSSSNTLHIALGAEEKLEIIGSTLGKEKQCTNIDLISQNEIIINSSNIGADNVEIKANKIKGDKNSKIKSPKLKLEATEYDGLNITSNNANINGTKIDTQNSQITLRKITDEEELQKARLIDTLRKIKEKCEQTKIELLQQYKAQLEEQSVHKLLKKM